MIIEGYFFLFPLVLIEGSDVLLYSYKMIRYSTVSFDRHIIFIGNFLSTRMNHHDTIPVTPVWSIRWWSNWHWMVYMIPLSDFKKYIFSTFLYSLFYLKINIFHGPIIGHVQIFIHIFSMNLKSWIWV